MKKWFRLALVLCLVLTLLPAAAHAAPLTKTVRPSQPAAAEEMHRTILWGNANSVDHTISKNSRQENPELMKTDLVLSQPVSASTSDTTPLVLIIALMILSVIGIGVILYIAFSYKGKYRKH